VRAAIPLIIVMMVMVMIKTVTIKIHLEALGPYPIVYQNIAFLLE
jgi:hypothetical protein